MALVVGLLSVAADVYIFLDLRRNLRRQRWIAPAYAAISVILWIAMVAVICMPYRSPDQNIMGIMWFMYAYISVYAAKLIFCFFSLLGAIPRLWRRKPVKLGLYAGLPLGLIVFVSMWWGALVTRSQIEVRDVEIFSTRLPAGFDGYRIVQISDLHVGTWGEDTRFLDKFVDSVNAQKPDLIVFTGDIVNRRTDEMEPFLKTLSRLRAKDGVYSVLGNHDYGDYLDWPHPSEKIENMALMYAWQKQIGWHMLSNRRTELIHGNDSIQLIGVENWGEPPFHQYGHLTDAYPISTDSIHHLRDHRFKLLLSHNPEHWRREVSKISNIDLTLSGHTHAMQIELQLGDWRWSPSEWRYEEWGGLYSKEGPDGKPLQIYVNIGAGEVGMPFRIGAVPEITVITLRNGQPQDAD